MANFHLTAKTVSRGGGKSAVAKAAYNAREKLLDERSGEMKDYRDKGEVLFSGIFAPKNAPEWAHDREALWNAVEQRERRKDAQLAIEIEIALPHELTDEQRKWLVTDFVREQFSRKGIVADVNIHPPPREPEAGKQPNHHAHILLALREIGPEGFGERILNSQDREREAQHVEHWREAWERTTNRHLERHGIEARIDRRTLEAQGIDREPTRHRGPHVDAMERKGIETERGAQIREAEAARAQTSAPQLGKTAGEIRLAYTLSQSGQEFVDGLDERGLRLARVTLSDVQQNAFAREFCAEHGKRIPAELHLDEVAIVNRYGAVYFLNERTTGDSRAEIAQYLGGVTRDLPSMAQVHQDFIRQAEFVPDPELQKKSRDELRELRTELMVERRELREQLANDELLPSERAALQERDADVREQQAQVRHALREMYVAEPSRFTPEAREMSHETPLEGLARSVKDAGREAADLAAGLADMAGKAVEFVTDFFITPSAPTPEMIHAQREARENAAEAQQVKAKTNEQDDRQRQIDETARQMKEREEQYKRLRENDPGRERER